MSEEYQKITEDYFKQNYIYDKQNDEILKKDDPRPDISNSQKYIDQIKKKESIELVKMQNENNILKLKNTNTILNESFESIFDKMVDKTVNFSDDFNTSLVSVKYKYDLNKENKEDYTFQDILILHIMGFVKYASTGSSIAYIGIFLIFISFLIYILNILLNK
jgi:hypothetical protein